MNFQNLLQLFQGLANKIGPGASGDNASNGRSQIFGGSTVPAAGGPAGNPTPPPGSNEALANTKKWLAKHNSSDIQAVHHAAIQQLGQTVQAQQQQINKLAQNHVQSLQAIQGITQKLTQGQNPNTGRPAQPQQKPMPPMGRIMAPFQQGQ